MFFERLPEFVMMLQSFLLGEPAFTAEREIEESVPVTGRIEWIPALGRESKEDLRTG